MPSSRAKSPQADTGGGVFAAASPPESHHETLRQTLPVIRDFLQRRRADLIDESLVDDYLRLNWLEWHGGDLRLTITGQNICAQVARPRG